MKFWIADTREERISRSRAFWLTATLTLALFLLLIPVLHHSLKAWNSGLFEPLPDFYGTVRGWMTKRLAIKLSYPVFLLGGMFLSAALYAGAIMFVRLRSKGECIVFALFAAMTFLLVLYPCRELLTVLWSIALLLALRQRGYARYIMAGVLYIAAAFLISPYLLLTIPVYGCVRIWSRSSTWGIRAFLLFIAVVCVLYECGVLLFVAELRPDYNAAGIDFVKVFPPEDYAGHISYYLLDYLYTACRILVPYEGILSGKWLMALISLLRIFMLLLFLWEWSRIELPMRDDAEPSDAKILRKRMRADAMVVLVGAVLAAAVFVTDYIEAFRFLTGFYPIALYVLFGERNE